jgi:hypothetical protein
LERFRPVHLGGGQRRPAIKRIRAFLAVFWAFVALGLIVVTVCASMTMDWHRWAGMLPALSWMVTGIGIALIVERIVASIVTGREESGIKATRGG